MKKMKMGWLGVVVVSALVSFVVVKMFNPAPIVGGGVASGEESAFERVLRTGVLRCSYIVYPPETIKDPTTGELSGVVVDVTEEAAKRLGLKVEWVEEVNFSNMFEGLRAGSHDAVCAGIWENPRRARVALFTTPIDYGLTYAFVRGGDTRFDKDVMRINDPNVTIAVLDGEFGEYLARERFPKAKLYHLPSTSDVAQVPETVASGKADVAFAQKGPMKLYMQHNPGKLKVAGSGANPEPISAMPGNPIAVRYEDWKLKLMLDAALNNLINNGFVEEVIRKYDPDLDSYALVAVPFR